MSNKSEKMNDFRGEAKAAGGSHETLEARMGGLERLAAFLHEKGSTNVKSIDDLKTRHIAAFVASKLEKIERADPEKQNGMVRTLQNQMSFIRVTLAANGRADFAKNPVISNEKLGIPKASRQGTKTAATPEQFKAAVAKMATRDAGMAAILRLERSLGLRGKEGVMAAKSLGTWEKALAKGETCKVIYGTKGGRPRDSHPADRAEALAAVRHAIAISKENGGKLLGGDLQGALDKYKNEMSRHCELTGHQLRYAYAQDRQAAYTEQGYSKHEANSLTAADLGHGPDRPELINGVYCQNAG